MSQLFFTPQQIQAYWDTVPRIPFIVNSRFSIPWEDMIRPRQYDALHCYYLQSIEIAEKMQVHADGLFPWRLLHDQRPNEPAEVQIYREKIWTAKTKPTFTKVFNSLAKIRRSADWIISYPNNDSEFTKIADGESLKDYCELNLPFFTSVTDWAFSALLRKYLIDPNAVVMVSPLQTDIPLTDYLQPYPIIFDSLNVLDYVDEDYAVLLNPFGAKYYDKGIQYIGKSMYIITTETITRYDQVNAHLDYVVTEYTHNLGWLPAFQLGGTLVDQTENKFFYESRIAGMIPDLDEAAREYSDLQAVKVLHQFPTMWEYTNAECKICHNQGRIPNPAWFEGCTLPLDIVCDTCHGQGFIPTGPFAKIYLRPNDATNPGQNIPAPPGGFIEKDVQIIAIQESSVQKHLFDALSAINFDFLASVPLSQSGVSKQYDRNESNNTTHAIAEDIVSIMDKVYKAIAYYRYSGLYVPGDIDAMLPVIPVPENYDLYSIADAQTNLNAAKAGKTNPVILNAMERDYSNKLFSADTEVRDRLDLILCLDPLPNITEDEKMSRLSNKGITQITYVISSNIQEFVQQALEDDDSFADKDLVNQKKVMTTMAQAVIDANSATAKIIQLQPVSNIPDNPANTGIKDTQTVAATGAPV